MTMPRNPVDPPDYATWPTARRLLRLWREQWRLAVLSLACAFAYSSISIVIPVLVARTIDRSIVRHDESIWPLLATILGLAALRFGINFSRLYATARIGVRLEAPVREVSVNSYVSLPSAFYSLHA